MNSSSSYASESLLGPPSELISVKDFILSCSQLIHTPENLLNHSDYDIELECSVVEYKELLDNTLSNPFKYSHLIRSHEENIESALTSSKSGNFKPTKTKKRKRADLSHLGDSQQHPDTQELKNHLDKISLTCWQYPNESALFVRPPKNSDYNILTAVKKTQPSQQPLASQYAAEGEAVIVVSIYNRPPWSPLLCRSSQHVVLSSQTLGDLYDTIPCTSNELPSEIIVDGKVTGYSDETPSHRGAAICIEGVVHGDGQSEEDYSDKLIRLLELPPERKGPKPTKGSAMHDQKFRDLNVRLNAPYWLFHQGMCEHFLVIEHIRMLHPSDPKEGYPLTLHISPPILDLCMTCARVPATLSVVGDIRLGQTPYKVCRPCWKAFGEPSEKDEIIIVPLPRYEHGLG